MLHRQGVQALLLILLTTLSLLGYLVFYELKLSQRSGDSGEIGIVIFNDISSNSTASGDVTKSLTLPSSQHNARPQTRNNTFNQKPVCTPDDRFVALVIFRHTGVM